MTSLCHLLLNPITRQTVRGHSCEAFVHVYVNIFMQDLQVGGISGLLVHPGNKSCELGRNKYTYSNCNFCNLCLLKWNLPRTQMIDGRRSCCCGRRCRSGSSRRASSETTKKRDVAFDMFNFMLMSLQVIATICNSCSEALILFYCSASVQLQ